MRSGRAAFRALRYMSVGAAVLVVAVALLWVRAGPGDQAVDEDASRAAPSGVVARFWKTADAATFADLQHRAAQGDAVAQREVAWAYERCSFVAELGQDGRLLLLDQPAVMPGAELTRLTREAGQSLLEECAGVENGQAVARETIVLAMRQAALGGDLEAVVMDKVYSLDPGLEDAALWERTIAERHVGALRALSSAARSAAFVQRFGHVVDEGHAPMVVELAACRLGYDCGPGSPMMRTYCLQALQCGAGSFEEMVMRDAGPAERTKLKAQVDAFVGSLGREGWQPAAG